MAVVIIGSGGDHNAITRIVAKIVTNQATDEQVQRYEDLRSALAELADAVDPPQ